MATPTWDTLTIAGVGLLGGSIALAARRRGVVRRVVGWGRSPATLATAQACGAIDEATQDLEYAVRDASLVVICTPVAMIAAQVSAALQHGRPDLLVTDVGSTKAGIVSEVEVRLAALGRAGDVGRFVGSHPLAGSERTGVRAARADLFEGRTVIVTPSSRQPPGPLEAIERFWQLLGARTVRQSPVEHDRAVAAISHVPHIAAAALAAATPRGLLELVASGWLDTTRVAAGDVELWRQILAANRTHVLQSLDDYLRVLSEFRDALAGADDAALVRCLEAGKKVRDAVGN